jgi:hypothetical protein
MIKKFIYYTMCGIAMLSACTQENDDRPRFAIDETTITLPSGGGIKTVTVTTSATWDVFTEATWLRLDRESGTGSCVITITAENNVSLESRSATITIDPSPTNVPRTITVIQAGFDLLLPSEAGAISGANSNECPNIEVLLSVAPIAGADTYEWYLDGTLIGSTTAPEYAATVSGAYVVAGKNATGEGTPGPEKRITIIDCGLPPTLFIDELVGDWDYSVWFDISSTAVPDYVEYGWVVTVTKINNTTIRLSDFPESDMSATATIDNTAKTIKVSGQRIGNLGSFGYPTNDLWVAGFEDGAADCPNMGKAMQAAAIIGTGGNYSISFPGWWYDDVNGTNMDIGCITLVTPAGGSSCLGYFDLYYGMELTKRPTPTSPQPMNAQVFPRRGSDKRIPTAFNALRLKHK